MPQFWGKYRGSVIENIDPLRLGRLQVLVPAVLGDVMTAWAMPCVPYAGLQVGFFMMPPTGAGVWVEFEGGDADYPIWSGCFWREGELPVLAELPTTRMIKTSSGLLQFNDLDAEGGLTLLVSDPAVAVPVTLMANSTGFSISLREVRLSMIEDGVSVTAAPAELSVMATGVVLAHGSASIAGIEPEVTINEGSLTVL